MYLNQALKEKNKKVKRLAEIQSAIQSNNSILKGNPRDYDPIELLKEHETLINDLCSLKVKIAKANLPILENIIKIGELKSKIAFLRKVSTNAGKVTERYSHSEPSEYESIISKKEMDSKVSVLENNIEKLQNEIDAHNATCSI